MSLIHAWYIVLFIGTKYNDTKNVAKRLSLINEYYDMQNVLRKTSIWYLIFNFIFDNHLKYACF